MRFFVFLSVYKYFCCTLPESLIFHHLGLFLPPQGGGGTNGGGVRVQTAAAAEARGSVLPSSGHVRNNYFHSLWYIELLLVLLQEHPAATPCMAHFP